MLYDERILSLDKETRFEDETSTLVCGILKNSNEENSSTPIVALLPKQFSMENKQQVIQHYECLQNLNHFNVANILGIWCKNGDIPHLIFERSFFLDDLFGKYQDDCRVLDDTEIVSIMIQLLNGFSFLFKAGVPVLLLKVLVGDHTYLSQGRIEDIWKKIQLLSEEDSWARRFEFSPSADYTEKRKEFQKLAEGKCSFALQKYLADNLHDPFFQHSVAICCSTGRCGAETVEVDSGKAVHYFTLSANQGDSASQVALRLCYKKGKGVEVDFKKAIEWFTVAATSGHSAAQFHLALCYSKDGVAVDLQKAVKWYTIAAKNRHSGAQCNLGLCYKEGEGVEVDLQKAVEWSTVAAKNGHYAAQCNLAVWYQKGEGMKVNLKKAVKWFTIAAKNGHAKSQFNLAWCYWKGEGVEVKLRKVVKWFTAAATNGHSDAQCNLAMCYKKGEGVEVDFKQAAKWYTVAAKKGHTKSQFNLGLSFYKGEGVAVDLQKAVEWYTRAAMNGHSGAQCNLAVCYWKGEGVEVEFKKAVKWFTAAATNGHSQAQYNLAWCYWKGEGVEVDFKKAVEWFAVVAYKGNAKRESQDNLKKLLEKDKNAMDQFEIIRTLGSGSEGIVFMIEVSSQTYTLKMILNFYNQGKQELENRYTNEWQILARLESHPNTIKPIEIGRAH